MTPQERAMRALVALDPSEAIENDISEAVAQERDRCVAIVKRWFGGDSIDDQGYECVREIESDRL